MRHPPTASAILCMAAFCTALFVPRPAAAHAILMESRPAALTTIAPGPTHFTLRYNSRIDTGRSRFELRQPGTIVPLKPAIAQSPGPDTVILDAPLTPGAYTLRWQVLAVDGHITRGDVPFTVQAP